MRFTVGSATEDGGWWRCTVLRDGATFCATAFLPTRREALERAAAIAAALNRAEPTTVAG